MNSILPPSPCDVCVQNVAFERAINELRGRSRVDFIQSCSSLP